MRHISPLVVILALLVTLSCQKNEEGDLPNLVREEEVVDYSLHCEENFVAEWCGANRENSLVIEVCVGTLIIGEQVVQALSLQENDKGQCFILSDKDETIEFPGCASASLNTYVSDLQGANPMEAVVCSSQGQSAYLEGASPTGEIFRAFNIQ